MPTAIATELRARSLGSLVPARAESIAVAALFRSALDLRFDGCDVLVAITGPAGRGQPAAIALDRSLDFLGLGLVPGDAGYYDGSRLFIRGTAALVRVDCEGAERRVDPVLQGPTAHGQAWEAAAAELGRLQSRKATSLRLDALLESFRWGPQAADPPEGGKDARNGRNTEILPISVAAAELLRWTASDSVAEPPLDAIAGRGEGLTPAGDDFICGLLAAFAAIRDPRVALLARAAERAAFRCNEVSASALRCAARGRFSDQIASLTAALVGDMVAETVFAVRELCALGHSSGSDIATGLLAGVAVTSQARGAGGLQKATTDRLERKEPDAAYL